MRVLRAYPALLRAYLARAFVYRAELFIYALTGTLPLVMMFIWLTMAEGGDIQGYSASDFVGYYLAAILIRRITGAWFIWDLDTMIRQGEISPYLLRPMNTMHYYMARVLSVKAVQVPILLVPIGLVAWLMPGQQFDLSPLNLLAFVIACIFGLLFEFFSQHIIAALAFWISQSVAINDVWFFLKSFFGGYLVPLALMPVALQGVLSWLPFWLSIGLPVEILIGRATPERIWQGYAVGAFWLGLLWLVNRIVWRAGIRAYSAVGA
jgi:ABC-2 type transport system permease protein